VPVTSEQINERSELPLGTQHALTDGQLSTAMAELIEDSNRYLAANRDQIVCGPTNIDDAMSPSYRQEMLREAVHMLHQRGMLAETLRRACTAKRTAAQAAALARARLNRHRLTALRLPSLLCRARQRRPARRATTRTGRPAGRKKRHRGSSDDPGAVGLRRNGGVL
jgi:hypothetical protein